MSRTISTDCTIDIEQTHEHFHAHVTLDGGLEISPGDRVVVHGAPVRAPFGQRTIERRPATLIRAGLLHRIYTRLAAHWSLGELAEVSFSAWRL